MTRLFLYALTGAIICLGLFLWREHYVECRSHGFSNLYCLIDR